MSLSDLVGVGEQEHGTVRVFGIAGKATQFIVAPLLEQNVGPNDIRSFEPSR
jgi:hypothetical protein